jgi:uncharacterized protein (TIGR00299 family) protein
VRYALGVHIHLDPVGGIAGDMFVAALLDRRPDLGEGLREALRAVRLPASVRIEVVPHKDRVLTGTRFVVRDEAAPADHAHTPFREIRRRLAESDLAEGVRARALDIFARLADAEGRVHGLRAEEVTFHEVGAWDSIADIVGAAFLIDALGARGWSTAPLPLGSGRVRTAHGPLPVPAPATALLLEGLEVLDDGVGGERVTPTGAAILRHLEPTARPPREPLVVAGTGIGFGTRELPGLSNVLRALFLDESEPELTGESVAVIEFEVDDQSGEDLAVALDHVRDTEGVLDVLQAPAFGKKGRLTAQVRILADPTALDRVIRTCFRETTTLGLRWHNERRSILERSVRTWVGSAGSVSVKAARRPSGALTGKAEIDDVADGTGGFAERERLRREAEAGVLRDDDDAE